MSFTNYQNAFDSLSHGLILEILFQIGLSETFLSIMFSLLENRTQSVKFKENISKNSIMTTSYTRR
jgi:uncharacterized protein YktB (UPF0637 family)